MKRYYESDRLIENIREPYPLAIARRTPLSVARPDIAMQWHYEKNEGYGPEDFSYGSNLKVWWRCQRNKKHVWQAVIANRTGRQASDCPHCYFESYGLDLRQYPKVLKLFDRVRNPGIDPFKIPVGYDIWWHCKKGIKHVWKTRFNLDVVEAFCPFCRGRKAAPDNNIANYRAVAKQFDTTKNGNLKARDLVPGSKRIVHWKCDKGEDHEWQARPYDRLIRGLGCPYCSRKRFSKTFSLLAEYPEIAKQWHKTKNGALKPDKISSKSRQSVWWKCGKGKDHEWQTAIKNRTYADTGCPFCANRAVSKTNSLAALYPEVACEFDLKKNKPLTADQIVPGSAAEYWWKCAFGHSWKRAVYLRAKRGAGCPECPRLRTVENPLSRTFPKIARYWHPTANGDLKPSDVSAGSHAYVWWKCSKGPDHEWQDWIRVRTQKDYECPFCAGFRVSVTNGIAVLFPGLAAEWHDRLNEKSVSEVKPGSAYKAWWICRECKFEWQRECYLRTQRGSACPACKSYPR